MLLSRYTRRREVIALLCVVAFGASSAAAAQEPGRPRRIGFLGNSTAALEANLVGGFRDGLRDLGYVEGRNVAIEYRWAEGQYDRLAPLIAELAASKVDVIVTAGTPAALAVGRTAPSIPLVMVAVGDPIGTGLAVSLARPGGNATGLTSLAPDLEGKRLELIREMQPNVSRLAVFWNPANAYQIRDENEVREAAHVLKIPLLPLAVRSAEEFDGAFAAILAEGADAMLVLADRVFLHNRERIVAFAAKHHRPMLSAYRELAEDGGLMSFGPSYAVMHRQAARYVDKILKGEKPAELPIEQPARFEFVINLKRAKALGLTIPPTLLARADEVIE
jgi:putative ABC transport system substrate-binding protein